jgi:shikimate kinase
VGRKLAKRLSVEFKDSDQEVEKAAGCSVADIYSWYGEQAFQDTEKRVMMRLLEEEPHVISTGVETFKDDETRQLILEQGFSVWLCASLETLYPRVAGRSHRPQLEMGDKKEILQRYISEYYPIYEKADFRVDCDNRVPDVTSDLIVEEIAKRFWD